MIFPSQWHSLKLSFRDHTVTFSAGRSNLRARIHEAFIRLSALSSGTRATIHVRHPRHGWLKVCDAEQRYPIIQNPLRLNPARLWQAIGHTLAEADSWPTDEEKARIKLERQMRRRAEIASARRNRFRVIDGGDQ
ncbi:hypothetical protein HXX02_04660 [Microbulbifer elongatus]|uniref:Uncharacterized protein n=1 Tax=Microbulbifer elongatus TaxID=86173 RepID=A0ABT1NXW5_9GAMM|nr:hypothetical protein [Microbulbifer elongatus]MCQ3828725.1 hypothetical protein [Microbulbifer elongatus]